MVKRYLLLAFCFSVFSFGLQASNLNDGGDSSLVRMIDIKFNFKINAFVLNFPDHAGYQAVLYASDSTWEYKLFHNEVLIENKREEEVTENVTKQAINVIFKDIEKHNDVLTALAQRMHPKE
ncbi:MAG: hypothetical protein JXQ87_11485 [Bacteroidia bacterium]